MTAATPVFGQLAALAEATRCRMLLLLERQPLSVSEVCTIMQLPQSTVSRHLKVLVDEGWAGVRAAGASRVYRLARLSAPARRIWDTVRQEAAETAAAQQDRQRLNAVLEARRGKAAAFFSDAAGAWERVRADLFGASAATLPLLALLDAGWTVGDLGCGTGQVARTVAPFVRKVIGVDASRAMLSAAGQTELANVEFREGALEALPVTDAELDVALLFLVLTYVVDPGAVLLEAVRALKPGGRLIVLDMLPHENEELREAMQHLWPGFSGDQMDEWLSAARLEAVQHISLPVDARARGPALFVTRATKPAHRH